MLLVISCPKADLGLPEKPIQHLLPKLFEPSGISETEYLAH